MVKTAIVFNSAEMLREYHFQSSKQNEIFKSLQ